jgi:hypothetical protein
VLRRFQQQFPRMQVQLHTRNTIKAKEAFEAGECDLILTTEDHCGPGGETLPACRWSGSARRAGRLAAAPAAAGAGAVLRLSPRHSGGARPRRHPMGGGGRIAIDRTLEAAVSCDMAIHALLAGTEPPMPSASPMAARCPNSTQLPRQPLHPPRRAQSPGVAGLADLLRRAWSGAGRRPWRPSNGPLPLSRPS